MKRSLLIFLGIIAWCSVVKGQENFISFEQEIVEGEIGSVYTIETTAISDDGNIIAVAKIETENSVFLKLYKIDQQLEILGEKHFKLDNNWIIYDALISKNGNLWIIGDELSDSGGVGLVHVYDSDFNLVKKVLFPTNVQSLEDIVVKDGLVYVAGQYRNESGSVNYNLRKFHQDGTEIWSKYYGGVYFEVTTGDALAWTLDSNLYFTGSSKNKGNYDPFTERLFPNPYTLTLDTAGNVLAEHVGGSPNDSFMTEYIGDISVTHDGGFILAGTEALGSRTYLEKVSSSGRTEWVRDFVNDFQGHPGLKSGSDGLTSVFQLPDSSYLCLGYANILWRYRIDSVYEKRNALYHFSPNGELLNLVDFREIDNYFTDIIGYSVYRLFKNNEFVPINGGKQFAVAGEAYIYGNELPQPNTYQSLGVLLLLDSNGCLTPGCLLPKKLENPRFISPTADMLAGDSFQVALESTNAGDGFVDNWGFQLWVNGAYKGYAIHPGDEPNALPGETFEEIIPNYWYKRDPNKSDTLVASLCLTEDYNYQETYTTTLIIPALNSTAIPEYKVPVENIQLYPNPTHSITTLSISNDWPKGSINVVDITGKIRQTFTTPTGKSALEIDAGQLSFGNYFIWLNTPKGDYLLKRLVVN